MRLVNHYFATVSDEQFERDIRDAGMGELVSWSKLGIQLSEEGPLSYSFHKQGRTEGGQKTSFDYNDQKLKAA